MSRHPLLKAFRLIAFLAMATGILSLAHHGSAAHLPRVAVAEIEHHGHWHDEDGFEVWDDHAAAHTHSHNAGDHSHVAMTGVAPPGSVAPVMFRTDWQGGVATPAYSSPLYSLDRPPRSVLSA